MGFYEPQATRTHLCVMKLRPSTQAVKFIVFVGLRLTAMVCDVSSLEVRVQDKETDKANSKDADSRFPREQMFWDVGAMV